MDETAPEAVASQQAAEPVVTDNRPESRFEVRVAGEQAGLVQYHLRGQVISLLHTEVDDKFQGMGLAGRLARFALDSARDQGLEVLPFCPYIKSWIAKHPDYASLVPEARRAEFGL